MTPAEKAKEITDKLFMGMAGQKGTVISYRGAKAAAAILCDEIIKQLGTNGLGSEWWKSVKMEIEKL